MECKTKENRLIVRAKMMERQSRRGCCSRTFGTANGADKAGESINWGTLVPAFIIPVEGGRGSFVIYI